jgi:hypothetical protein
VIWNPTKYPTTLAASTLIILFSEILNFLEIKILKETQFFKGKYRSLSNILFVEMKISKLIN